MLLTKTTPVLLFMQNTILNDVTTHIAEASYLGCVGDHVGGEAGL